MLSKFRSSEQAAAQAAALPKSKLKSEGDGGSALGRIPLVRIRRERDGSKRVPYLARLLSSFLRKGRQPCSSFEIRCFVPIPETP